MFSQKPESKKEKKYLTILNAKEYLWTEQERILNVVWDSVKILKMIPDTSLYRYPKYNTEKGKNGIYIISYTEKKL